MELFVAPHLVFEKIAAEVTLPDDPNAWPNEILQELFKQVPYLADFEPHIVMDRADGERGYAFGHVEVSNKTDIQHGAPPGAMEAAGVRAARIPIIVRDRRLQPFDVIVTEDSQMLPLTEARLRQAIFRPQAFDITARTPGDMSMIGQLYPPYRQNYGFGGGGAVMGAGMGKDGAASLLGAIMPTIHAGDYARAAAALDEKPLQAAFMKNAHAASALATLAEFEPVAPEKTAAALVRHIPPTVVQIVREPDGYVVKSASDRFWAIREERWSRPEVLRAFGDKIVLAADLSGSATLTVGADVAAPQIEDDKPELITRFGIYKVQDDKGRELVGFVFPNLLDIDGTPLPIALFTNGSQAAVQGEIVGVEAGGGASLFEGHPRGHGAFYEVLPNGRAQATVPLTIRASLSGPEAHEGVTLSAETFDGRLVEILVQPNLARVTAGEEGRMLVPETMRWLPLEETGEVVLASEPEAFGKTAAAKRALGTVVVRAGGDECFSFDGLAVAKLAAEERSFLATDDALFLLAGLGVAPSAAGAKLAEALSGDHPVAIPIGRALHPAREVTAAARARAESKLASFPSALRPWLIKEAAVIPDPVAVDTVLSLGFLNQENLATFVTYLSKIDEAQKHMCELLVAARLGLREIPASALEKAIRATEPVLEGLKVMAFQAN